MVGAGPGQSQQPANQFGTPKSVEETQVLSHHLLSPRVHICQEAGIGIQPSCKATHSGAGSSVLVASWLQGHMLTDVC